MKQKTPYFWIYLFLLPTLVGYGLYTLYPIGETIWFSLTNMKGLGSKVRFIGLRNYVNLFKDELFINSLKVTAKFMLMAVPVRFFVSLAFALLLNWKKCRGKSFFRTVFFLPSLTTSAIIGVVFILILDPTFGPVNLLLNKIGVPIGTKALLGTRSTVLPVTSLIWVWKWMGYSLVYWLASLQSIPEELYEAAKVDGASSWQSFRHIVAPLLVPFAFIILMLSISDAIRIFNLMLTLTGGGPYYATETVELFIYRHAFLEDSQKMGYASAAASVFAFIFMIIVIIQNLVKSALQKKEGL
ncbi:MAG: sugar ABC transporter permease [Sphaerochaetaceae bacterium]|nr:sugar ABC transporter permease [Sphaerochaetaceae bacterium]